MYSFRLDWDEWALNYQQVHQILSRSFEMVVTKVSWFGSFFLVVSPNVKMKDGFITSVVFDNLALTLILGVSPARDSRRASDHFGKMGECLHHSLHHAPF